MKRVTSRKLNRLSSFDYSSNGYYFVTICMKDRIDWFGSVKDRKMNLNKFGEIVNRQWEWLSNQYNYIKIDTYIVMPNHFHGILIIDNNIVGTGRDLSLPGKIKSTSELIGAFKTTSSKLIHNSGLNEFSWQRSYYDHIIRNEKSLQNIREYIFNNPLKWDHDPENPNRHNQSGETKRIQTDYQ